MAYNDAPDTNFDGATPDASASAPPIETTSSPLPDQLNSSSPMQSMLSGGDPQPQSQQVPGVSGLPSSPSLPTAAATTIAPPANKWERLFQTIAIGLSGGAGAKNFGQGLAGGAKAQLDYQQQQKENAVVQQQLDMKKQQLSLEQQRTMDEHQVAQSNLASAHINQQILAAQYNTMPKTSQDIIDRVSMEAGEKAKEQEGAKVVGNFGTYAEAQAQQAAYQKANPNTALSTQLFHNANGGFDVIAVPNPEKLNDKPVDVTIGYNVKDGKPITKTYAAGTISYAQRNAVESQAAVNATNANNSLEEYKQHAKIDEQKEISINAAKIKQQQGAIDYLPKATSDQKKKADLADNIAENAAQIKGILSRRPDILGKIQGRITQGKWGLGTDDGDIAAVQTAVGNLAKANASVHGLRSHEGIKDTENQILNGFKNGAPAVDAALDQTTNSVQTFVDAARPATSDKHSSNGGVRGFYERQTGINPQGQQLVPAQNDAARLHKNMNDFAHSGNVTGVGKLFTDDNKTYFKADGSIYKGKQ